MRINEVLAAKPTREVITIAPDATVRELVRMLGEHNVGALIVSRDGSSVEGIVSERDVVRHLDRDEESVLDGPVSQIMTAEVLTCEGHQPLSDVMQVMTEQRFRHLPVLKDGRLDGIISIGDVVKARIGQLQFERDQLDSYVHSAQS